MKVNLAGLRKEYKQSKLDEQDVEKSPINQFKKWFQEAIDSEIEEPNAVALATVTENQPSLRIVLLKGLEEDAFIFFTNYKSKKGREIEENPNVALTFFWAELERQVRIEGKAMMISSSESTAYYQTRNRGSRIGAWASPQSEVISGREILEEKVIQYQEEFKELGEIPRPEFWGGYKVIPHYVEFWQGRPSRLHDRIAYTLKDEGHWDIQRLAP